MPSIDKLQPTVDDLQARLAATRADLRDLATMGTAITSVQEINSVLSLAVDMGIRLVNGEVGAIMLEEHGEMSLKASWGLNESSLRALIYQDGMDLPSYCFKVGQSIILNDLGIKQDNGISIDSIIALPLRTSKEVFGVMLIINRADGSAFEKRHQEQLEMLLNFVTVAIDNSRLIKEKLERQRIEQEMAIARQVQETILPRDVDQIDTVEIGAIYFPANEVGGDYYDVVKISDDRFLVVIADVSNKGVPAALVMSAAAGIIKSLLQGKPDISVAELAERLNNILADEIIRDREMFVTIFFCMFDTAEKKISYCNGGHLPGLYWEAATETVHELADGGPILGQFPGISFKHGSRQVCSGDRLFLFTDGLTEAADRDNNLFGRERAEQVFALEQDIGPTEFCLRVKEWVDRFAEGASADSHDDFTILQVRVK